MNLKKYKIEFVVRVPEGTPERYVEKWAGFMVGYGGVLKEDNPLYDEPFDPVLGTFKIEAVE